MRPTRRLSEEGVGQDTARKAALHREVVRKGAVRTVVDRRPVAEGLLGMLGEAPEGNSLLDQEGGLQQ